MADPSVKTPDPDADGVVGVIEDYPCVVLPNPKWRWTDGSVLKRDDYSLLFSRMGTTWNTGGEAADEFRLPPSAGIMYVGWDPADADFDTVGDSGGTKAATMPTHAHTLTGSPSAGTLAVNPASHSHAAANGQFVENTGSTDAAGGGAFYRGDTKDPNTAATSLSVSGSAAVGTLAVSDATGSGDNMPPYRVVRRIIKVK